MLKQSGLGLSLYQSVVSNKDGCFPVYRYILLIAFVSDYLMGAKIFQALQTDIQKELKNSFLEARKALMSNYANITPEELEIFLQVRGKGVLFRKS